MSITLACFVSSIFICLPFHSVHSNPTEMKRAKEVSKMLLTHPNLNPAVALQQLRHRDSDGKTPKDLVNESGLESLLQLLTDIDVKLMVSSLLPRKVAVQII